MDATGPSGELWSHGRSHGRTSDTTDGRYALADDLSSLADEPGEHVILAKLDYWLGPDRATGANQVFVR